MDLSPKYLVPLKHQLVYLTRHEINFPRMEQIQANKRFQEFDTTETYKVPPIVYIWMPDDDRHGHVAMELTNGTYISWWPPADKTVKSAEKGKKDNKKFGSGGRGGVNNFDLDEDVEKEEGYPDHTIYIPAKNKLRKKYALNEEAMEEWWAEWSSSGHYELISYNCAWAVYSCLRKGGAPRSATVVWRPETMRRYLRLWLRGANAAELLFNLPMSE